MFAKLEIHRKTAYRLSSNPMRKKASTSSPTASIEDVNAFKDLFWKARKEHARNTNSRTAEVGKAHQKALELAESVGFGWGQDLLLASLHSFRMSEVDNTLETLKTLRVPEAMNGIVHHVTGVAFGTKGEYDQAIESYKQALATQGYDALGSTLNNLGLAYYEKGEYDQAIDSFKQALATPGYDTAGMALSNLGIAYAGKGEYDQAIGYYKQALATPSYDTPGDALNNLGLAYYGKGEYDQAITYCKQALAVPGYDTPGKALNNLGIAYAAKGDYDQAIDYYKQALATRGYNTPHLTRNNLANAFREAKKFEEAKDELSTVLAEDDREAQHSRAKYILSLVEQQLKAIQPTSSDEALADQAPKEKYAARMQTILQDKTTQYDQYIEKYTGREAQPTSNEFAILRGWSSAVTLLEGATNRKWPGGGYFLRWREKGLVIDPGFDFLDNFHEAGYHILDVHAVAVSHDHIDHNGDLRSLDDLCYETHRNPNNPRAGDDKKTLFMLDLDSKKRIPNPTADHRGSLATFDKRAAEDKVWLGGVRNGLPFQIEHFQVKHSSDVPEAQGFRVVLIREDDSKLVVGYTGDTCYDPRDSSLLNNLDSVDILLAHVSQPSPKELIDQRYFKEDHLGYNGVTELVRKIKPKLTLVGEFWAGLADLRLEIVGGIRHRTGLNSVLPACLGLRINLDDLTIRCTKCRAGCSVEKIKVVPPTSPFGDLGYLCPDCVL
jgi:Tfp pilus assembly protein PilF/ribonuclease BN (tRNA processing enzyme)